MSIHFKRISTHKYPFLPEFITEYYFLSILSPILLTISKMANPIHKLSENLEETLNSFKNILSFILRNQHHLELSQMQMIKEQERHFDALRWMISALNKEDLQVNPPKTLLQDDEDWEVIKADPIFGKEGWVEVPRNI